MSVNEVFTPRTILVDLLKELEDLPNVLRETGSSGDQAKDIAGVVAEAIETAAARLKRSDAQPEPVMQKSACGERSRTE